MPEKNLSIVCTLGNMFYQSSLCIYNYNILHSLSAVEVEYSFGNTLENTLALNTELKTLLNILQFQNLSLKINYF
jgi:hypothetical protein